MVFNWKKLGTLLIQDDSYRKWKKKVPSLEFQKIVIAVFRYLPLEDLNKVG